MRIGVDAIPLLWRKTTGIQNHARGICRALAASAVEHEFVLLYEKSAERMAAFDDSFIRSLPANWEVVAATVMGPTEAIARYCWERRALPKLLRKHGASVYYSMSTRGPLAGPCPVAITIHDLAREAHDPTAKVPRPVARLAGRAARIFTVSQTTAQDVERILNVPRRRLVTVYDAPAPGVAPAPPDQQALTCEKFGLRQGKFLLCVGEENWRRKYEFLWETLEAFWSAGHLESVAVVFVGRRDWQGTDLHTRARRGAWRDGGVFLNNLGNEDLGALYSAALATVVPTEAEGFGMPVVEAMACGCPVLCSDIPVLHEVADDAARYFDLKSHQSLADQISTLAHDAELRDELSRRGLKRCRRYTWQAAADTVLATLRSIAAEAG